MKTFKITVVLVFATLFLSCCNSNDEATPSSAIAGQWKLINVTGGFAGVNDSFPAGQITWTVDTTNHTVTVVNNNTNPNLQDILETGTYSYSLTPDPNSICTQTFNVNNMDLGCYTVSNTELIITFEYADGFTLTLIR